MHWRWQRAQKTPLTRVNHYVSNKAFLLLLISRRLARHMYGTCSAHVWHMLCKRSGGDFF
jgi:hypothetical protein